MVAAEGSAPPQRRAPAARGLMLTALVALGAAPAGAWDGYDAATGAAVTIEGGNLVRPGETIKVYDWSAREYRELDVESIDGLGYGAEVEVYDPETGDYLTLEMED